MATKTILWNSVGEGVHIARFQASAHCSEFENDGAEWYLVNLFRQIKKSTELIVFQSEQKKLIPLKL
jgi:hypothetical protein